MTSTIFTALFSHWRRHPLQLATLVIGLALATALWSAVQAINTEARVSYERAARILGQEDLPELRARNGAISRDTYVALRRAGWQVTPILEGEMRAGRVNVTLVGIEPMTAPPGPLSIGSGDALAFLRPPGLLLASPETRHDLQGAEGFPPIEARAGVARGRLIGDIGTVERLLERPGEISRLQILPDQPLGRPALAEVAPDLMQVEPDTAGDLARLTDSFHLNLAAFGVLSFAVGLFIVHAAVGLAFEQRRTMFRTLRAIGAPLRTILVLSVAELAVLALVAGSLGVALGYVVAGYLLPDVAATLRGLYGADVPGSLAFRPLWALAGLAMALTGTFLAALQALWRLSRLSALGAAQPRAWARASGLGPGVQAAAGGGLWLAALGFLILGDGLVAGFAGLAGLLLGAALILPAMTRAVLHVLERRARTPTWEWFWADTTQQLPGLSLALMALLLALATTIGVTTMVSSFRLTFTGYLDQRLASELYVTARNRAEAQAIRAYLAPRSDAVLPIWSVPARIAGRRAEVYGIRDHATYRENWPIIEARPDVWDDLAAGKGALINEQLSLRAELVPGDPVTLGPGWSLPVLGVYSDYGNPEGQVIVSNALLSERYADEPQLRFGVRVDPAKAAGLMRAMIADLGLPPSAVTDQATIKAFSLGIFERTFTVTGSLSVLTLGIAAFALLTSLLTLSNIRLPQLAPVWALGLTRQRLARLELLRTLFLAAITYLFALPVGLALAWVLLAVVNVEAFGWRLPMFLFPLSWLITGAAALAAAALAAAIPVRRLGNISPALLLGVFAHER